jgi:hypothetical protein
MTEGEEMGAVEEAARVRDGEGEDMGLKAEEPTAQRGTAGLGGKEGGGGGEATTAAAAAAAVGAAAVATAVERESWALRWAWLGLNRIRLGPGNWRRWWGRLPGQDTGRRFSGRGGGGDMG